MTHEEAWTFCKLRAAVRRERARRYRRWYRVARRWMLQGAGTVGLVGGMLVLFYFGLRLGGEVLE